MNAERYIRVRSVTDRIIAGTLLLATLPISAGVAVAVRAKLGSPVLFSQERVGRYGRRFKILKFRTMIQDAEKLGGGYLPKDLNLIPPLGAFLRKTSLDEIPQLINIVRGDMGFVGPRPALPDQFERYTPEQARRVEVPQGLTGLAQVRFRNEAPWSKRIRADVEYVDNIGPRADCAILIQTVRRVLRSDGVRLDQTADQVDDLQPRKPLEDGTDHAQ